MSLITVTHEIVFFSYFGRNVTYALRSSGGIGPESEFLDRLPWAVAGSCVAPALKSWVGMEPERRLSWRLRRPRKRREPSSEGM
ncbi:uncharacterized protein A4U43_C05F31320 [Asparagus officinalis]|uniref:Uncharacterized protein n=1 Tax=Asparagus officinalis TaxID=4686 RepID=A0A5P1EWB2_ASPOF|nr:uncharacterized protein A4U43_C05F31320 [Asparagus officinalis]